MRFLLAQINPTIGDLEGNTRKILDTIFRARKEKIDLVVFPELALCGYPPEDLLLLPHFSEALDPYLDKIVKASLDIGVILGMPRINPRGKEKKLFNSAAVINDQMLIGFQDKSLLPTYDVFDERRYFEPAIKTFVWEIRGKKVGITICEDIWKHSGLVKFTDYQKDPISDLKSQKPDCVINLSASPYQIGKFQDRLQACKKAALTLDCPVLLCNQIGGNDSLIFDGYSFCIDKTGNLSACAKGFEEDFLNIDLSHMTPPITISINKIENLYRALVLGVRDYFQKQGFNKACLGLSGGIDSAIVTCIAVEALGTENVLAVLMPSRYSSQSSIDDSLQLAANLGIQKEQFSIEKPFQTYLDLLEVYFQGRPLDATEENLQARCRGMVLMAISNKLGYIVLSTGNKSELAMGYATLYGDMCGGLGVINDVTKSQVYELGRWINRDKTIIPLNILKKPPSAELKPNQKDSDTLPDYEIIDNVLKEYVEEHRSPKEIALQYHYPLELVQELVKKIHCNEYKRRQSPPGLRVSPKSFSIGRRFPIVQRWIKTQSI
jgi:NAD+ synthase (glutamine-hydrolysing)